MKPSFPLALGSLLLFLAACQLRLIPTAAKTETPLAPSATPVPPSATPAPPTPAPTTTGTPTPNPTPLGGVQATATPDPNLGVGDVVYEDKLDGTGSWGWGYVDDAVTFSISGGRLNAVMSKANVGPRFTGSPETVKVGDQQVRVTAIANLCYEHDEYGLLFRTQVDANDNYNTYVFKLSCGGAARVELVRNVQASPLVDWMPSQAIVPGAPAENTLMVWMAKDQFHFYVNDKYLFSMKDATLAEGFYGLYVRDRTNGGESVSFANLTVRAVKLP